MWIWCIYVSVMSKNVNHDMKSICSWFTGEHFYMLVVALNRQLLVVIYHYALKCVIKVWKVEMCHIYCTLSVLSCQKYLAWGPFLRASRFVDVSLSVRDKRQTLYKLETKYGGKYAYISGKREQRGMCKMTHLIWNYTEMFFTL